MIYIAFTDMCWKVILFILVVVLVVLMVSLLVMRGENTRLYAGRGEVGMGDLWEQSLAWGEGEAGDGDAWNDANAFEGAAADEERVDRVFGVTSEPKKGDVVISGSGRMSKRDVNNLTVNGKVTLDTVKVKDTLTVNGYLKGFNVEAATMEVSGGAMLKDSKVGKLVIHNPKQEGQRPNIVLIGSKVDNYEITDKKGKVEDFVVTKEKMEPKAPRPAAAKAPAKKPAAKKEAAA